MYKNIFPPYNIVDTKYYNCFSSMVFYFSSFATFSPAKKEQKAVAQTPQGLLFSVSRIRHFRKLLTKQKYS